MGSQHLSIAGVARRIYEGRSCELGRVEVGKALRQLLRDRVRRLVLLQPVDRFEGVEPVLEVTTRR